MRTLGHDALLAELIALRDSTPFALAKAADTFLKGVAGTFPRGRSVLLDALRLRHFQPHGFQGTRHCEVCGLPFEAEIRTESALASAHAGHASNEVIENVLPRWQEVLSLPLEPATQAERAVLDHAIKFIADAPEDETPGQLEKRLASARMFPKTDKYKRHGILQTLAECGVLPNDLVTPLYDGARTQAQFWDAHKRLQGSTRSDIVLPLAGWRGHMGVDFDRYVEVFGTA